MNPNDLTRAAKAELATAFKESGLSNAAFARKANISEGYAHQLRDPDHPNKIETLDAALRVFGKRIEIRVVPIALALALLSGLAIAQPTAPEPNVPLCTIRADVVIHTYTGPIAIDQLCMAITRYDGTTVHLEAQDFADGIFRDGFDGGAQ